MYADKGFAPIVILVHEPIMLLLHQSVIKNK